MSSPAVEICEKKEPMSCVNSTKEDGERRNGADNRHRTVEQTVEHTKMKEKYMKQIVSLLA